MKLQVLSDLHLEITGEPYDFDFPVTAPSLALLGDIGNTHNPEYFRFLETQLERFDRVFLVLGNHEPYKSSWEESTKAVRDFEERWNHERREKDMIQDEKQKEKEKRRGEFIFLDRRRWDWPPLPKDQEAAGINKVPEEGVTILGCTLFSQISASEMEYVRLLLQDFRQIASWTADLHNTAFSRDAAWLRSEMAKLRAESPRRKVILLTHHAPTRLDCVHNPRHKDHPVQVGSAFATEMRGEEWWRRDGEGGLRLAVFGHTHWNCDVLDEETGVRVIANQRGYVLGQGKSLDEGPAFDAGKVVGVEDDGWRPRGPNVEHQSFGCTIM